MRLPIKRTIRDPLGVDHPVSRLPWWTLWLPNPSSTRDLRRFLWRIGHALFGRRWGCSCTTCFDHPKRRVPAAEVYADRRRIAMLEERLNALVRAGHIPSSAQLQRIERARAQP